ncbi:type IV pilin N-terminal domain-containing protein [Methanoculleus sp. 10]|uniref:type IV pilin N-terminal domain-containing protein n=1 Tax=Methanoculleus sp. 10 TaxID=430615 RepID=UPI0025F81323|nr:type IV pilin N-terminal domain-containing protein [Methanoculleus sp. 10]
MMKFRENEDAVSPVIGVILMVAITVILAAVIAAFVFGMSSDMPDTTKNVAIGVKGAADGHMTITVQGGTDLPRLTYLKITVGDSSGNDYYPNLPEKLGA